MDPIRLLVCGNRTWRCRETMRAWLIRFPQNTIVVHGGQRSSGKGREPDFGADHIADELARELGFAVEVHAADWDVHGDAAGPIRNAFMARQNITRALAFGRLWRLRDGRRVRTGTGNMVDELNDLGVLVSVIPRPGVHPR